MSVEAYVRHATALLALSSEADSRMRRQQASAERAARDAAAQFERERRELTQLATRLETVLASAQEQGVLAYVPAAKRVDVGSDPVELLRQLLERLEEAVADAAHTRRVLDAQRAQEREQVRRREQETRRRREQEDAERRRAERRERLLERGLLGGGVVAVGGAGAAVALGSVPAAAPVAALALAAFGTVGWRRRAR